MQLTSPPRPAVLQGKMLPHGVSLLTETGEGGIITSNAIRNPAMYESEYGRYSTYINASKT
jgi:hypothetical protein